MCECVCVCVCVCFDFCVYMILFFIKHWFKFIYNKSKNEYKLDAHLYSFIMLNRQTDFYNLYKLVEFGFMAYQ